MNRNTQQRPARGRAIVLAIAAVTACGGEPPQSALDRYSAMADSMMPQLERLSGLTARGPVQIGIRTAAEVRTYLEQRMEQELPAEAIQGMSAAYVLLGLLPDTLDLRTLLLELYQEQVAGYYDPATRTLYVVEGIEADQRTVMAHELVHALQDQNTDLDSLISRDRGNDRQTAAQAAMEGHATLVMIAAIAETMAGRQIDPATLPDAGADLRPALESADAYPVLRQAPRVVREAVIFPYVDGARFVQQLWKAVPAGAPRQAPIGEYLPQSTEQVLLPLDRFVGSARDEPTELRFEDDPRWPTIYENTFGAFETGLFLQELLGTTLVAATGWDGDRYRVLRAPEGRALVWVSLWDDQASADRFAQRVRERLANGGLSRPARLEAFRIDGRPALRMTVADADVSIESVPQLPVHCVTATGARTRC